MQSDRRLKTKQIQRDKATADTKRKIVSWTKWEAADQKPFEINYDRTVSFCVVDGQAAIEFSDGTIVDLQPDDFVTIYPDIKGIWTVVKPITNLYMYHDVKSRT